MPLSRKHRRSDEPRGLAAPAGSVKIRLTRGMRDRLEILLQNGLHGTRLDEVAERLLCRALVDGFKEDPRA